MAPGCTHPYRPRHPEAKTSEALDLVVLGGQAFGARLLGEPLGETRAAVGRPVGQVTGGAVPAREVDVSYGFHGHGSFSFRVRVGCQRVRENATRGSTGRKAGTEAAGVGTGALPSRPARAGLAASAAALMGNL